MGAADVGGGIFAGQWNFAKRFGEFALGKGGVPGFVPVVGDVSTGILAAAGHWKEDANRCDLNTWERLGRAGLDGTANLLGSMGGSLLGGGLGLAAGGTIGTAVGGGIGAPVGGFAGGLTGDLIGSYLGSTAADSAIDALLD